MPVRLFEIMNNTHDEILERTKQILVNLFEIDESLLTPEARLYEDLDIDSIDAVDLLVELKRIVGKKVSPDLFRRARTLQDVVDIVANL